MRRVAVIIVDGVSPFDLGIACEAFAHLRGADGGPLYAVEVCAEGRSARAAAFDIQTPNTLAALASADTIVVPGSWNIASPSEAVCDALRAAARRGARIASICTGAFVLAAAGLLDGRRATTHWMAADELARRHPLVTVDPNVLFVDDGDIVSSAGASAGMDMCLHLIGRDHGQAVAAQAARLAVAPLHRDGGQAQFIVQATPPAGLSLAGLLEWMAANVDADLDLAKIAARAGVSPRTLARRFHEQVGTTPIQWLLAARVRHAQALLERSSLPVDHIALASGFESPVTFRARFTRVVGISPSAYRRRFSGDDASSSARTLQQSLAVESLRPAAALRSCQVRSPRSETAAGAACSAPNPLCHAN